MKPVLISGVLLGFVGAGMFYSHYIGFGLQNQYLCPLCPHVTTLNLHPLLNFASLTIGMGALNAVVFSGVGATIRTLLQRVWRTGKMRSVTNLVSGN